MLFPTGMRRQQQHNSSQRLTDACRSVVDCYRSINTDTTGDMFRFLFTTTTALPPPQQAFLLLIKS